MPATRFAPTPSGFLHAGNACNLLLCAALAQRIEGRLVLRIDDLDQERTRPEYIEDIRLNLHWLLPDQAESLWTEAHYSSAHPEYYFQLLKSLRQNQQLYACRCSRADIQNAWQQKGRIPNAGIQHYPGTCREADLSLDQPGVVWRLKFNDMVLRQRNGRPAYQLSSVADDLRLHISHVLRGADLLESTSLQLVLAERLSIFDSSFAAFAKTCFIHHPLLTDPQGGKLSKSAGATAISSLRQNGWTAEHLIRIAGKWLGIENCQNIQQLAEAIPEKFLLPGNHRLLP